MGNGRKSGQGSRSSAALRGLLAAVFTLLVAASVLLGLSFRYAQHADSPQSASPLPASSRSIPASAAHSAPQARSVLGQLPLMFEPNRGQAAPQVKFLARGSGYTLSLDSTSATLGMQTRVGDSQTSQRFVRMKLVGANAAATMTGTGLLPGKSNYFIGNDRSKWHSAIPQFSRVQYKSVYPGINLVFYGKQGQLEYDFQVAPGADPSQAELQFDGATHLQLQDGDLILTRAEEGGLRLQAPQIYQRDGDRRQPVAGHFVLRGRDRVGFEISSYDRNRELVIDPILEFASYFGGTGSQTSPSVAVNGNGNIYLVGSTTTSAGFPVPGTLLTGSALPNIFVAEITPSSPATVTYLTFLGGSGSDTSVGLAVDGGGDAFIVGNTSSTNFPTSVAAYQPTSKAKTQCTLSPTCTSVFVSELNPQGTALVYSTYLSGTGSDQATGMAIDTNQDVFVTGTTSSTTPADAASQTNEFPVTYLPTPFQTTALSPTVFFVTKINTIAPGASGIAYSTYFGGGPVSGGTVVTGGGIAVDAPGNIYFSGTTNFFNSGLGPSGNSTESADFPILNPYQPCLDVSPPVTSLNPANCQAPATTPYPTDAFVAKLNPNNAQTGAFQLLFSTYVGGSGNDTGAAVAVDPSAANVYLTGSTTSSDIVLPTLAGVFQGCLDQPPPAVARCTAPAAPAPTDAYVARLSIPVPSTTGIQNDVIFGYFSYLGGTGNDSGAAIAADGSGDAFVTGSTSSGTIGTADPNGFPVTTGAIQSVLNGSQNAFFARLNTNTGTGQGTLGSYSTYYGGNATDSGTSVALDPVTFSTFYFAGDTTSSSGLALPNALQPTLTGTENAFVAQLTPVAAVTVTPTVLTTGTPGIGNAVSIAFTVTNNGPDLATGVYINGTVSSTNVTFGPATAGGGSCSTAVNNSVVCTIPTLQVGTPETVQFSVTPNQPGTFSATAQVAKVNNTNTNVIANASFTAGSFTMSVSPASATVAAGQTAPYSVLLSPIGAFGNNVSLACSGAPSGATCNFSSTSVSFSQGTGSASAALNISTTPQPVPIAGSGARRGPLYALALLVPGMAFFGVGGRRRRARWLGLLAFAVVFTLVALQPACSSNKQQPQVSGTPSGTYAVTVTATSGTFSQSKTIQLTVTP